MRIGRAIRGLNPRVFDFCADDLEEPAEKTGT